MFAASSYCAKEGKGRSVVLNGVVWCVLSFVVLSSVVWCLAVWCGVVLGGVPQGIFQTPTPQATELLFQPGIVLFLWLVESALICSTG